MGIALRTQKVSPGEFAWSGRLLDRKFTIYYHSRTSTLPQRTKELRRQFKQQALCNLQVIISRSNLLP